MNKSLWIGVTAGTAVAVGAGAVARLKIVQRPQYAEVVQIVPLTRTIRTPRQVCHDQTVVHQRPARDPRHMLGTVAGALIGGVLGNQLGGGSGKALATAAGAAAGGYAGNRIENRMQLGDTDTTSERRCVTVYDRTVEPEGYEVRYRLEGREGRVHLPYDPGSRIPVKNGRLLLNGLAQGS
jgi:uncharacterized protein YcfJ